MYINGLTLGPSQMGQPPRNDYVASARCLLASDLILILSIRYSWFSDRLMGFFLINFLHKIYEIYMLKLDFYFLYKLYVSLGNLFLEIFFFFFWILVSLIRYVSLRLANSFLRGLADWLISQICDFLIGFIGLRRKIHSAFDILKKYIIKVL